MNWRNIIDPTLIWETPLVNLFEIYKNDVITAPLKIWHAFINELVEFANQKGDKTLLNQHLIEIRNLGISRIKNSDPRISFPFMDIIGEKSLKKISMLSGSIADLIGSKKRKQPDASQPDQIGLDDPGNIGKKSLKDISMLSGSITDLIGSKKRKQPGASSTHNQPDQIILDDASNALATASYEEALYRAPAPPIPI
eukprot:NODE_152_length_15391_cov_0.883272.p12 type:complete len:197 gc:universal NODE_152_length_15391_cov_0.883272:10539-9949(-)